MEALDEIARKARLHGGWVERTIVALLERDMTARRTDANQTEIVATLRQVGASVQILSAVGKGCPDLLVGYRGINTLLEVKDGSKPPSARALTPDEQDWQTLWRGQVVTVTSAGDALMAIGAIE